MNPLSLISTVQAQTPTLILTLTLQPKEVLLRPRTCVTMLVKTQLQINIPFNYLLSCCRGGLGHSIWLRVLVNFKTRGNFRCECLHVMASILEIL